MFFVRSAGHNGNFVGRLCSQNTSQDAAQNCLLGNNYRSSLPQTQARWDVDCQGTKLAALTS